jgi:hypothetical protein
MMDASSLVSVLPSPIAQILFVRFSQDKKETFLKLVILSLAAILCKPPFFKQNTMFLPP